MSLWLDRVLTRERVARYSIVVLAVNVALYAANVARGRFPFDAQGTIVLPDFMSHVTGGALARGGLGDTLYDVGAQGAFQAGITHRTELVDVFLSPPLTALLYLPFTWLSYAWAAVAWTGVSLGLLALVGYDLFCLMPSVEARDRRVLLLAVAASPPVIQLLGTGQDTAMSLLLWCAGTRLALAKRDEAAGAVFALGLFKPQLFLLPPLVFLARRRWRALAAWMGVALAIAGATVAVFGTEAVRAWLRVLGSREYLVALRAGRALRMASVIPLVRSVMGERGADAVGGVICLGILAAAIARMRAARDERSVWGLACVTTLLVTPHLFDYDLALLALPAALMLEVEGAYSVTVRGALVALAVLTWTAGARAVFEGAGWPARLLAASWAAVPMFVLWREIGKVRAADGRRATALPVG